MLAAPSLPDVAARVLSFPSTMVIDPVVRRQLEELEDTQPAHHRRALVRHAIADRELELATDGTEVLLGDRLDDELLNGLNLILALLP